MEIFPTQIKDKITLSRSQSKLIEAIHTSQPRANHVSVLKDVLTRERLARPLTYHHVISLLIAMFVQLPRSRDRVVSACMG